MAKWHCEIATKGEFVRRLEQAPELILVRGVLQGRFGFQSLPTVLDDVPEAYVTNTCTGWSALVLRGSRNRLMLCALP